MQHPAHLALNLAERGLFPDAVLRWGIRRLLTQRLQEIRSGDARAAARQEMQFIDEMRRAPIAVVPEKPNDQHYEVPVEFFRQVLGPHLKYSSAFWPATATTLAQAEAAGLRESCLHTDLMNGQTILELGCGWGPSRCGWLSTSPTAVSRRSPIPVRSGLTSKPKPEHAAYRTMFG